ncbi:MAG: Obg family GTPase CgtA, partial [Solirubrobacterales bacterium]
YGAGLDALPELVVLSKRDLLPPDDVGMAIRDWRRRLGGSAIGVLAASSATGEGFDDLRDAIFAALSARSVAAAPAPGPAQGLAEFEVEHRVYRPVGEGGYSVQREEDGGFRILGRGVELLFERHDTSNEEALAYLESRLNEIGVVAALRAAGFEPGDDVRIGEHEFELYP